MLQEKWHVLCWLCRTFVRNVFRANMEETVKTIVRERAKITHARKCLDVVFYVKGISTEICVTHVNRDFMASTVIILVLQNV